MSDLERRIAQFQNMTLADPENEMAHFSLGNALIQAGRHAEAARSFLRCTELAPTMSKAYQLAAEASMTAGDKETAAQLAVRGYTIAAERGDLMPKTALADLLGKLGRAVPTVERTPGPAKGDVDLLGGGPAKPTAAAVAPPGGWPPGTFIDRKTGRPGTKMSRPPFRGPVGEWIQSNISSETFDAWIAQGTKVINELRLDLSRDQDEATYDQQMREYLGIDDGLFQTLTRQAPSAR